VTDRVTVPRMLSRAPTMWISVAATVLGFVGLSVYFGMKPDTRVAMVVFDILFILFFAVLLSRRVVIDTRTGTVTSETLRVWRRTATWDRATLQTTYTGQRLLSVGPAHIPLAADDMGGERSQSPEFLELLAGQVEQWAPDKVSVVRELRARAAGRPHGRSRSRGT
jgi:hypothetical protein